jgi:hypothetical protein
MYIFLNNYKLYSPVIWYMSIYGFILPNNILLQIWHTKLQS